MALDQVRSVFLIEAMQTRIITCQQNRLFTIIPMIVATILIFPAMGTTITIVTMCTIITRRPSLFEISYRQENRLEPLLPMIPA